MGSQRPHNSSSTDTLAFFAGGAGAFGDCGRFDGPATALASDFRGRPLPFLPMPSGNGAEDEDACFDGKGGGLRGGT